MRLASLLPMLLLLVSPLTAQQNCQIFDLTAAVDQFNPNTCQFNVVLNFNHAGTTNQFFVKGNGNTYGPFTYNMVPLTLGPFQANPLLPTSLEFVVQDAINQDCSDNVTLDVPPCVSSGVCDINNLTVVTGNCHPLLGTYDVTINFQASTGANQTFQVYTAAGVSLGVFPVAALPVTLPIPWGGSAVDILKICIDNQPDCCKTVDFQAPACIVHPCDITDFTVVPGDCTSDSTYKVKVNFSLLSSVNLLDSFQLSANGHLVGTFALNQLPLPLDIVTDGGVSDIVKICVTDVTGAVCCVEKEFPVPACLQPCAIHDLTVQTDSCTSDSTFGIWVNFTVSDSTQVDSFDLWGNTHFIGHFGLNQLPLHVADFQWNGLIFNNIRVCTGNSPACCKEFQFLAPDCLPFDSTCEITNIFALAGACTSDSTYRLLVNFNGTNPGNGTFLLFANGTLVDTFNLADVPITLDSFPWNGGLNDVVTICIGSTVPGTVNTSCCKSKEFAVPTCLLPCDIHDLHVETGDCNPQGGYALTLNFAVTNAGNDLFDLYANGTLIGTFPLTALPLHLPNFPGSGNPADVIKVCINDHPNCCAQIDFQAPNCNPQCEVYDLAVETGACDSTGQFYALKVNFGVHNPASDSFDLYAAGTLLGTFPLGSLPLLIPNFPASGNAHDVIKVCIHGNNDCCKELEFQAPNCNPQCEVYNLHVETGACDSTGQTYALTVNFGVHNPGSDSFDLYAGGTLLGTFPLGSLPLLIPNFPASGNAHDVVKVCIHGNNDCCKVLEFQAPNCNSLPCEIYDLHVETGDCNPAGGYALTLNFGVHNPGNDFFDLYANGVLIGTFPLTALPLHIPSFIGSGNPIDVIKVCINDHPDCCKTIEFQAPQCGGSCAIHDLAVQTGDCNQDGTYNLWVNFIPVNTNATTFVVWGNGQFLGTYSLDSLPLHITHFPWDGTGPNDIIKVCIGNNAGGVLSCCESLEFPIPDCLHTMCDITDLHVQTGNCTGDSIYQLTLNFNVSNPPGNVFGVWANGQFLGMYGLGQLPLTIQDFPWNGGPNDVVKVCFGNNTNSSICCATAEFAVPGCLTGGGSCNIFDFVADPGDCTGDSTYNLAINFHVTNPPVGGVFVVFANGVPFGTYNISQLPLVLHDFPWNGGPNDVVRVCFVSPNGLQLCCESKEFAVPGCLTQGGNCEITGVVVDPGTCTSDSTYQLFLNFQVNNPPGSIFGVWANNTFLGTFNVGQLPLTFPNFPWNGGQFDVVKICFITSGAVSCCKTVEFPVPTCLGNNACHIYDMVAVHTTCLCGQFFVAVTFKHQGGGAQGFDITGNGNNYGNFPYNMPQPIILGPFPGDGSTIYEFNVADHNHPDCHDAVEVGVVDCQTPTVEPGSSSSLKIAPNPASSWINVTAQLENGVEIGQATVKIYHADGRLIQTLTVGSASSFLLDISNYPAGVYRMSILAGAGRLEGSFTKQY